MIYLTKILKTRLYINYNIIITKKSTRYENCFLYYKNF